MGKSPLDRVLRGLESGRRPAYVSLLLSVVLAGLTAFRFVVLVQRLTPAEYGMLNVFTLLGTLMPLVLSLGLTLQYQRVTHFQGPGHITSLIRTSFLVTSATVVPGLVVILVVSKPFSDGIDWLWASVFILVVSSATALTTFYSQIMLGLNFRATASFMMFLVNAGATAALLPAAMTNQVQTTAILGWWSFFGVAAAWASYSIVRVHNEPGPRSGRAVSVREGILSIPSQVGPWLFIFVVRYMIGFNIDAEAIANYAISSTVVDMAFLVTIPLLNHFTNKVMAGAQSPAKGMLYAVPAFVVLAALASMGVSWLLPRIGQPGYSLGLEVTAILIAVGVVRIYVTAWRSKALGQKKIHVSSVAYILVVCASVLSFMFWPMTSLTSYAVVTLFGFLVVAVAQRISVRAR